MTIERIFNVTIATLLFSMASIVWSGALAQQAGNAPAVPSKLPGGASSLTETFDDWLVNCSSQQGRNFCEIVQTQSQQSGQRVLTISVSARKAGDNTLVNIVMPFGLDIQKGITAQIDEKPVRGPLPYSTCLSIGCVVPLSLSPAQLNDYSAGRVLKLVGTILAGEAFSISASLKGFSAAMKRARDVVALAP